MFYRILIAVLFIASYCKSTSAIELNCTFGNVFYTIPGSLYTCTATLLSNENSDVTLVIGNHDNDRDHFDVEALRIQSQALQFFPTNVEEFFPNLKAFSFYNNSISSITNNHLRPFPNLEYLRVLLNNITVLDTNLFSNMTSVRYIDFDSNNLRHVGHDIDLPDTGYLYFQSNPCIDERATTAGEIANVKLDLLRGCPPTISQIEDTLESRPNLITESQIRILELEARVALLEGIIEDKLGVKLN